MSRDQVSRYEEAINKALDLLADLHGAEKARQVLADALAVKSIIEDARQQETQ